MNVFFAWGIKDVDDTGTTRWNADWFGVPVWDTDFDITTEKSLNFLHQMCSALDSPRPEWVPDGERKDVMKCWVMDFKIYVEGTRSATDELAGFVAPYEPGDTKTPSDFATITSNKADFFANVEDFL